MPLAAELYAVIDVLVAVGFDLEHKMSRAAGGAHSDVRSTREREGLDLALCMLGEMAARHGADTDGLQSPEGSIHHGNGAEGDARGAAGSNGLDATPIGLLLRRTGDNYLGK